jgi:hypothetical protein
MTNIRDWVAIAISLVAVVVQWLQMRKSPRSNGETSSDDESDSL